jgi:hypothetical protein
MALQSKELLIQPLVFRQRPKHSFEHLVQVPCERDVSVGGIELRPLDGESRLVNGAKHIFQLARHQLFVEPELQIPRHAAAPPDSRFAV